MEEASHVEIDCATVSSNETNAGCDLQIKSVNGQRTASHYLHQMKHQRAEAMEKLREAIAQIGSGDLEAFIDYILRQIRRITATVSVPGNIRPGEPGSDLLQWTLRRVTCRCNGIITNDPRIVQQVIVLTRRHAYIFLLVMKKLEERISLSAIATLNLSVATASQPQKPLYRFRLTCSWNFMGALLRVMSDRNFVENLNVSELCRRMTNSFCTTRKDSMSARALRKGFDNPTPQILEQLLEELKICVKYVEKFIQRQRL